MRKPWGQSPSDEKLTLLIPDQLPEPRFELLAYFSQSFTLSKMSHILDHSATESLGIMLKVNVIYKRLNRAL